MRKKEYNKKDAYPIQVRKHKRGESYRFKLPSGFGRKWVKLGSSWEGCTYQDAVRAYKSIMGDIAKRRFGIRETKEGVYFKEFAKAFLEDLKTKKDDVSRQALFISNLNEFFGDKLLTLIQPSDIKAYIDSRLKKASPGTVRKEFYFLRKMFSTAISPEWTPVSQVDEHFQNPCNGIKPPKDNKPRQRVASEKEIKKLLEQSPNEVVRHIILFALYSGCRQGEILTLKEDQVNWESGYIHWPETKNQEPKNLPLSPALEKILKEVPRVEDSPHFFCSPKLKKPYTKDGMVNVFRRMTKRAGLKDLHFHDLRRIFGTKLAEQGYREKDIAELLGHKTTRSTTVYVEIAEERKKDAMKSVVYGSIL